MTTIDMLKSLSLSGAKQAPTGSNKTLQGSDTAFAPRPPGICSAPLSKVDCCTHSSNIQDLPMQHEPQSWPQSHRPVFHSWPASPKGALGGLFILRTQRAASTAFQVHSLCSKIGKLATSVQGTRGSRRDNG